MAINPSNLEAISLKIGNGAAEATYPLALGDTAAVVVQSVVTYPLGGYNEHTGHKLLVTYPQRPAALTPFGATAGGVISPALTSLFRLTGRLPLGSYPVAVLAELRLDGSNGSRVLASAAANVLVRVVAKPGLPGGGDSTAVLSWFQARALASAGAKIRRSTWHDRYLVYHDSLWWMQRVDAITKVLGAVAPVVFAEFAADDFRAHDWTADPLDLAAVAGIDTAFPR